ncbi:hypothetical protein Ddc_01572 [Ditylenchus destructor]|nr:hypothetical protein Ddc_01572 [Ditylenchus destructor]
MRVRSSAILDEHNFRPSLSRILTKSQSVSDLKSRVVPNFTAHSRPIYKPNWPYFYASTNPTWTYRFNRYLFGDDRYHYYARFRREKAPFIHHRSLLPRGYDSYYLPYSAKYYVPWYGYSYNSPLTNAYLYG